MRFDNSILHTLDNAMALLFTFMSIEIRDAIISQKPKAETKSSSYSTNELKHLMISARTIQLPWLWCNAAGVHI